MRWPFHRSRHETAPPPSTAPEVRRDWATLPPIQVAGASPIALTASRSFADQLASRQEVARTIRPIHHRRLSEPTVTVEILGSRSASGRSGDQKPTENGGVVAHRRPAPAPSGAVEAFGADAVSQLLAIDQPAVPADTITEPGAEPDLPLEPRLVAPERPGRPSLADSRRLGLGPAYHGPLPEAMRLERARVEPVPPDLRAAMHDVLGVDVGDTPVHRGPEAAEAAASIGAKAFARDGEVHVSDEVGPLDTSEGRAVVAHELTHVAQQRLRPNRPVEATPEGQAMELHAREVERFVRGDAGAPKPPPVEARTDDPVAEARDLMRELVGDGLARPDGNGGIVFTMPPASMTHAGETQRLTHPAAPAAPDRSSAAHGANWNAGETFLHGIGSSLAGDMLNIAGSMMGFSDEFMQEQRDELHEEDLAFGQQQTKEAFREMRMEHLRTRRLTTLHAQEDAAHQQRTDHLSDAELRQIEERVNQEVERRTRALTAVANEALAAVNTERARQGQAAREHVAPASYDAAFHLMFDHPDGDEPPARDVVLRALQAELGAAARHRAAPASPDHATNAPAPTGATTAPPTSSPTAPTTPTASGITAAPIANAPTPSGSAAPTTPTTTAPSPSPTAGLPTPDHGRGARAPAHQDVDRHRGLHWADNEDGERQWVAERNQTVGQNFSSLGRHLVGDVFHEQLGGIASVFGFDDALTEEIERDADRDLGIQQPARDRAASPGRAAAPQGGHRAERTAPITAHTAHDTVASISRDPYALDELALRLYPSIRTRLRQELLVDRERAGLLTDFR